MKRLFLVSLVVIGTPILARVLVADLSKAQQDYYEDREKIEREYEKNLAALAKKFIKVAERGEKTAMRAKDLERAIQWREWESELRDRAFADPTGKYENVAPKATVSSSRSVDWGQSDPKHLNDQDDDSFLLFEKMSRQNPVSWADFKLRKPYLIGAIRFIGAGIDEKKNDHGAQPYDYAVLIYNGDELVKVAKITDGHHMKREPVKNTGSGRAYVVPRKYRAMFTLSFEPTFGDRVEFKCTRTAGGLGGPILYEFEIMGR